jgi:hypothetical protein
LTLCARCASGGRERGGARPLGDARLRDLKPELEQFAVDAWRAPKRIFDAHPADQYAQLRVDLRSPSQWARLPTPVTAKAGPVPTHERLGPDDCENLQDRRKPAIQLDQEPAIIVREPDATRQPTPHDIQLMSKHRVLSFKPQLRLEWRGQDGQNEKEQPDHSASLGDSITASTRIRFSAHTGTGYALGVKGAGLASSVAVAIGVVTLWLYFQKAENYLNLNPEQWRPQIAVWSRILIVGLPAGGEFAIMFAYMAAIYYVLGDFGPAAQAGFSIGSRVLGLIQVPAMAIAFTAAPIIGQNFGAGNGKRIKETVRTVLVAATMVMVVATFVAQWRPEFLLRGFTQDNATIYEGTLFLKLVSLNLVAQGLIFLCSSTFQGLGNTTPQLISSTVRLITYVIPTLWLSTQSGFRVEHIWYLSIATTTMQALLSLWLLSRELRLRLGSPQKR